MNLGSAADVLAGLAGAGAAGFIDTKYATKADGTARTILGLSPGQAFGIGLAAIAFTGFAGREISEAMMFGALGVGCSELYRIASNKTAESMAKSSQAVQGLNGRAEVPQFGAANDFGASSVTADDLSSVFSRLKAAA